MSKRQRIKLIKSVWIYLNEKIAEAFATKDEQNFDWYSDGQEAFWCLLRDEPIKVTPRVKQL